MKAMLSPKDLAEAIGVSESSLRRWADEGRVAVTKTVGGHRRIALGEAVRFIRQSGASLVRPDLLGLPGVMVAGSPVDGGAAETSDAARSDTESGALSADPSDRAAAAAGGSASSPVRRSSAEGQSLELQGHLERGDAAAVRGMIFGEYLAGASLSVLCDQLITPAMRRIGEHWKHGPKGIVIEHRAVDLIVLTMQQLRALMPPHRQQRPVALGGAPSGDPYLLPSLMAATVLADAGFAEHNLGPDLPVDAALSAIEHYRPRLVWISYSSPLNDPEQARKGLATLGSAAGACGASLVVGGRRASAELVRGIPEASLVGTMSELSAYARGLLGR